MARTYKRDKNGRFAGGGGGGGGKPAARGISRGTNRLTRDNSGKITGVGGSGATARGGRLATAKGNKRATQTAKIASGRASGTIGKPKGLKPGSIKPKISAANPSTKTNRAGLTKAEYEAAAAKAWGRAPGATAKPKASANDQLDRLATRSGNMARSRTGLTAAEARKASDLGKATGRRVEVSQGANGGYSLRVANASASKPQPKVDTSVAALARRRSRANAERTSLVSQKVNMKSAVVRSAANAIYNRQRVVSKGSSSVNPSILRDGIGVLRGIGGSKRDRAMQNLEAATKRVRSGRRR